MDDVLQPEDDFDTWMAVFSSTIEVKGQYLLLVPGYKKLVQSILTTNSLMEPLNDYTAEFLMDFVPNTLYSIISLGYIYSNDHQQIEDFLKSTSDLLLWALLQNRSDLIDSYSKVLNNSLNYYQKNLRYNVSTRAYENIHWIEVAHYFIQNSIPKIIAQCISDSPPTKDYLALYNHLYSTINLFSKSQSTHQIDIQSVSISMPYFLKYIQDFNIRELDNSTLQSVIGHFTSLVEDYFTEFIESLLAFADDCIIKSDSLDKKFIGADILAKLSTSTRVPVQNAFDVWLTMTTLGEFVIKKDVHNKLLEKMQGFLSKLMKVDLLNTFLSNAFSSHSSQRATMFKIIRNSVTQLDKEESRAFVNSALALLNDVKNGELDKNYLTFLTEMATNLIAKDEELSIFLMNSIINLIRMPEYRHLNCSEAVLNDLSQNPKFQEPMLDMCLSFVYTKDLEQQAFFLNLLKTLIKAIKLPPYKKIKHCLLNIIQGKNGQETSDIVQKDDTTQPNSTIGQNVNEQADSTTDRKDDQCELVDTKIEQNVNEGIQVGSKNEQSDDKFDKKEEIKYQYQQFIEFDYVRSDVLTVLMLLVDNCNKTLSTKSVEILAKSGIDDSLFHFFYALQNARGSLAINPKATPIIIDIINCMDLSKASNQFTDFLTKFVFIQNLITNKLKSKIYTVPGAPKLIPVDFTIEEYPLDCFDLLFKACILNENKQLSEQIKTTILHIITKVPMHQARQMTSFLVDLISPYIAESKNFLTGKKDDQSCFKDLDHCLTGLSRCIFIIIDFIRLLENGYVTDEFGFSRHNPKSLQNEDTFPELKFVFENQTHIIRIPLYATTEVLANRISNLLKIGKSRLSLSTEKAMIIVTSHTTLLQAGITNQSTIRVQMNVYMYSPCFPFTFPSQFLAEINFQDTILELLSSAEKLSQVSQFDSYFPLSFYIIQLLDILPDSKSVGSKSLDEIKSSNISSSFRYCFEVYLVQCKSIDDLGLFVDILATKDHKMTLTIFRFLFNNFNAEVFKPHLKEMVEFCIQNLALKESIGILSKLISDESLSQQVTEYIYSDLDSLEESISRFVNSVNALQFKQICKQLTDQKPLFELCLKHIGDASIFSELFLQTVGNVLNSFDLSSTFDKCVDSLKLASQTESNFLSICQTLLSILMADPTLTPRKSDRAKEILQYALNTDNEKVQEASLSVVKKFFEIESVRNEVILAITPILDMNFDFFSYKPSFNIRSDTNKTGLRNLGSTCYMNSVLQQLFYMPEFIYLILTERIQAGQTDIQDVAAFNSIQKLFSSMLLTKKKSVDTSEFASTWKWGKNLINPREQQDAFEFFQTFLDQLPSRFHHFFKGTLQNTIEGENFVTTNTEPFYTFPLEVQNNHNMNESFKVFLQKELFEGYRTNDNRIIDAYKSTKIKEAPQILVIQLKRFEYDFQTFHRIKINDRFEFPDNLDIKEIVDPESNPNTKYVLSGVVLHCGTAQGGHYTSLKKIGSKWYRFNDSDVSILNDSEFKTETFGYNNHEEYKNSAYLLFYERQEPQDHPKKALKDIDPSLVDPQIRAAIEDSNAQYVSTQFAFSTSFFDLIIDLNSHLQTLQYLLNIYSHSSLELTARLELTIINQIKSNDDSFDFIMKNLDKIDDILIHCTNQDIILLLISLFQLILSQRPCTKETNDVVDHYIYLLPNFVSNWRQITYVAQIVENYLSIGCDQIRAGQSSEYNWAVKLVNFVVKIYENQKSSILIENINLSPVFSSIFILMQYDMPDEEIVKRVPESLKMLFTFSSPIMQSTANSKAYLNMMTYFCRLKIVDFIPFMASLVANTDQINLFFDLFLSAVKAVTKPDQAQTLFNVVLSTKNVGTMTTYEIIKKIHFYLEDANVSKSEKQSLRSFFYTYPNETLFTLLLHPEHYKRMSADLLIKTLFPANIQNIASQSSNISVANLDEKRAQFLDLYNNGLVCSDDEQKEQCLREMKGLYVRIIQKVKSFNIHSFYHVPSVTEYDKERRLVPLINLAQGISLCLKRHNIVQIDDDVNSIVVTEDNLYDDIRDDFYVFNDLLNKCAEEKLPNDINILQLFELFATFGPKAIERVYSKVFVSFFMKIKQTGIYFEKFWFVFQFCEHFIDNFLILLKEFQGTQYQLPNPLFRPILISLGKHHHYVDAVNFILETIQSFLFNNNSPLPSPNCQDNYQFVLSYAKELYEPSNENEVLSLNSKMSISLFIHLMPHLSGNAIIYGMNEIVECSYWNARFTNTAEFNTYLSSAIKDVCYYLINHLVIKPTSVFDVDFQSFINSINYEDLCSFMTTILDSSEESPISFMDYYIYDFLGEVDKKYKSQFSVMGITISKMIIRQFDGIISEKKRNSWNAYIALIIYLIKVSLRIPNLTIENICEVMNTFLYNSKQYNSSAVKNFFKFYMDKILRNPRKRKKNQKNNSSKSQKPKQSFVINCFGEEQSDFLIQLFTEFPRYCVLHSMVNDTIRSKSLFHFYSLGLNSCSFDEVNTILTELFISIQQQLINLDHQRINYKIEGFIALQIEKVGLILLSLLQKNGENGQHLVSQLITQIPLIPLSILRKFSLVEMENILTQNQRILLDMDERSPVAKARKHRQHRTIYQQGVNTSRYNSHEIVNFCEDYYYDEDYDIENLSSR